MQLLIKTLANTSFNIECDSDDSVRALKEQIAAKNDLPEKYDADLLKLLYTGKVLDDERTIGSYSVKSDGFLVLVKQTPGKPKVEKKKTPTGFNNFAGGFHSPNAMGQMPNSFMQSPFQQNPFSQQSFQQNSFMQQPVQQNQFTQQPSFQPSGSANDLDDPAPESFATAEEREDALESLLAMGFKRPQAEKALRASFYNVETAIEHITAGNIPEVDDEPALPQATGSRRAPGASIVQRDPPSSTGTQRQEGSGGGASSNQMQQISQMLQQNPGQLQVLKQQLQSEHPELAKMIDERPQDFLNYLKQASGNDTNVPAGVGAGGSTGTGGGQAPGTITVNLSPQDQQSITRLQDLGFERNQVIEAFLACDRNEQLAANYLLSAFD